LLLVERLSLNSGEFEITRDGNFVGHLTIAALNEVATLTVVSQGYRIYQHGGIFGEFKLAEVSSLGGNGPVVASATPSSVSVENQRYIISRNLFSLFKFSSSATIRSVSGHSAMGEIGKVKTVGWWNPDFEVYLPSDVSDHIQIFIFYMTFLSFKSKGGAS